MTQILIGKIFSREIFSGNFQQLFHFFASHADIFDLMSFHFNYCHLIMHFGNLSYQSIVYWSFIASFKSDYDKLVSI